MLGSGKLQAQGTASFACAGSQKILQRSREEPVDVCHTDFFFLVDFLLLCFWVCFLKEVLDPLEVGMAANSSILAWRIPWTEEPGGLQSIGLHRVRHD